MVCVAQCSCLMCRCSFSHCSLLMVANWHDLATTAIMYLLHTCAVLQGSLLISIIQGSLLGLLPYGILPGAVFLINHFITFTAGWFCEPVEVGVWRKWWKTLFFSLLFFSVVLSCIDEMPIAPKHWAARRVKASCLNDQSRIRPLQCVIAPCSKT